MPFIKSMRADAGPPTIYQQHPEVYRPWSSMSQALMNGPSPLSPAERELVLSYAAAAAGCEFVATAHSEVAYALGIENGLVERLVADFDGTQVEPKLKAMLAFVRALATTPNAVEQADADAVFQAGWDDRALHDAIAITARAAFMHRLVQGFGFTPLTREAATEHAKKRIEKGYVNLYPAFRNREPG